MKYVKASEKEIEEQLKRLRNGLHLEYGFAADFSKNPPILKISDEDLKANAKVREAEIAAAQKLEEEAADVAEILAPIESIATAPRHTGNANPPANS